MNCETRCISPMHQVMTTSFGPTENIKLLLIWYISCDRLRDQKYLDLVWSLLFIKYMTSKPQFKYL